MAEYAVLLDLDDTLVVQREAFEEAFLPRARPRGRNAASNRKP